MKVFKLLAVPAALACFALSASAMTAIQDEDLSQVSGQDGVSIVANLNVNIGSFQYTNPGSGGASVDFNNIGIKGLIAMNVDVLDAADFQAKAGAAVGAALGAAGDATAAADAATVLTNTAAATGYKAGSDVVQFAFPQIDTGTSTLAHSISPTITVASISTGHGGGSFGGFALKNVDLQGTTVWMYGH